MSCNRHPSESTVGVCAACLRERLLALLATSSPESPPSLYSASSVAGAADDRPRSSLLSTLFGRHGHGHGHGHGGRDKHRLRRFGSWAPALSRLFSASSAAAGTEGGTSPGDASPRVTSPRRASRETTKPHRLGLGGLGLCFVAAGDDKGGGFSGEIRGSRSSQRGQRHHKAAARRPEMEDVRERLNLR